MAGHAVRGGIRIPAGVASDAGDRPVGAGEREIGLIVIEAGWVPCRGAVAERTVEVEIVKFVIGIIGAGVIVLMASDAFRGRARVAGGVA